MLILFSYLPVCRGIIASGESMTTQSNVLPESLLRKYLAQLASRRTELAHFLDKFEQEAATPGDRSTVRIHAHSLKGTGRTYGYPDISATGSALEEVRLATEFLTSAQLPDAHLIVSDKPPALAAFAAVWRSEDAAGAVKIIPPGPDVSAIEIASNLIAVDPQLCKGDFTTARFHTDVGHRTVFSAVLSCSEANEERVTEYVIAPRQQGGFVVFAVIRSKDGGQALDLNRQNLEGLSRAAIQAVGGQG